MKTDKDRLSRMIKIMPHTCRMFVLAPMVQKNYKLFFSTKKCLDEIENLYDLFLSCWRLSVSLQKTVKRLEDENKLKSGQKKPAARTRGRARSSKPSNRVARARS